MELIMLEYTIGMAKANDEFDTAFDMFAINCFENASDEFALESCYTEASEIVEKLKEFFKKIIDRIKEFSVKVRLKVTDMIRTHEIKSKLKVIKRMMAANRLVGQEKVGIRDLKKYYKKYDAYIAFLVKTARESCTKVWTSTEDYFEYMEKLEKQLLDMGKELDITEDEQFILELNTNSLIEYTDTEVLMYVNELNKIEREAVREIEAIKDKAEELEDANNINIVKRMANEIAQKATGFMRMIASEVSKIINKILSLFKKTEKAEEVSDDKSEPEAAEKPAEEPTGDTEV